LSKLKTIKFLILIFLITIISSSCGNLEIDIYKDYSGEMIFTFNNSEDTTKSEMSEEISELCDEENEKFGKEVYNIESSELKDGKIEIVVSFISIDEYKDLDNKEEDVDFSDLYCGSYDEFFEYTDIISDDSVEKVADTKSSEFISLDNINAKRNMGIIRISNGNFSDLETIKINTPGKILYHTTNVDLEDNNTGEFSDEGIIIFENTTVFSMKTYVILFILLIALSVFILVKNQSKTCECGTVYEKGSVFCGSCGKKAKKFDFSKTNKMLLFSPAILLIIIIVIFILNIFMNSHMFAGKLDKDSIIDSLDKKVIASLYGDGEYTIEKDKVTNLDVESEKNDNGNYTSSGVLSFKSNNFYVTSQVTMKHIYIPGNGWNLVNLQCETMNLTPYKGPDKTAVKEAFEDETIDLEGNTKNGFTSVGSLSLYDKEYSVEIIEQDDSIEENFANIKVSLSAESTINTTNVILDCEFCFSQNDEKWIYNGSTVEDSSIEYIYSDDFKDTPTNEEKLLEYLSSERIYLGDGRYKYFEKDKFENFELKNIQYDSSGESLTYNISMNYDDEEFSYSGIWNRILEYSDYNSNDNWGVASDFENDVDLKMTTSGDIIHALENEGTIDGEDITFEDGSPKDFQILNRTDSDSKEEIEVSFTYNSKTVKFKLIFGNSWGDYKCLSLEEI
jgi:hypothetical protein